MDNHDVTRIASILSNEEASAVDLCADVRHAGEFPVYIMEVNGAPKEIKVKGIRR